MATEYSVKSFLIFCAFLFAEVLAGMMASPDTSKENEAYICWIYVNCISKDAEEHKRMELCVDLLDKQDLEIGLQWVEEARNATDYPTVYEAIDELYCPRDSKRRKEMFYTISQRALDITSIGCKWRHPQSTCDHYLETVDCMVTFLSDLIDEEKCDIGNFDD